MDLSFFKNLEKSLKNIEMRNLTNGFIEDLSNHLDKLKEKHNNQMMTIKDIEKQYKLTYESSCQLISKRNDILQEYAKKLKDGENLYYVSYKNEFKNTYKIIEFNNKGESNSFFLSKEELPNNISVDKVIRKVNDRFIIDNKKTKEIMDKVEDTAKELLSEQDSKLGKYREENCLYQVVDLSLNGVYLQNKNNNIIFEEVNIPKELEDVIMKDFIIRYKNGTYIFEKELTDNFFKSLEDINKKK